MHHGIFHRRMHIRCNVNFFVQSTVTSGFVQGVPGRIVSRVWEELGAVEVHLRCIMIVDARQCASLSGLTRSCLFRRRINHCDEIIVDKLFHGDEGKYHNVVSLLCTDFHILCYSLYKMTTGVSKSVKILRIVTHYLLQVWRTWIRLEILCQFQC